MSFTLRIAKQRLYKYDKLQQIELFYSITHTVSFVKSNYNNLGYFLVFHTQSRLLE